MKKIFIQTNDKQIIGAFLAKYALERHMKKEKIPVEIMRVESFPEFKKFVGKTFLKGSEERVFRFDDLQSFVLTRFLPPELMGYEGKAVVIDPDVFALSDIHDLFETEMDGKAILSCDKGTNVKDTSVMLLDCAKLKHWKVGEMLEKLSTHEINQNDIMRGVLGEEVGALSRDWNTLDAITPSTKMFHTTERLTQPWKTGLPIDFTRNKMPKIFGIIPREWVHFLLGKYPLTYQPHKDTKVETEFFLIASGALREGVVKKETILEEIKKGYIRKDFFERMETLVQSKESVATQ